MKKDIIKSLYEQKFRKKHYGKNKVILNSDHQKILEIIKEIKKQKNKNKLKILDIGCARGHLSAAIKKLGDTIVCGVELSETAAKEARKYLDDVIVGDIEEIDLPYPSNYFDIIICSNILEHLFNPKEVLIKLKKYLNKNGVVLVVLPNVAHYTIRLALLRGKWEYQESGILDIGHLRFFTKNSAIRMFKEAGYHVSKVVPATIRFPTPFNIIDKIFKGILTRFFSKFCDTLFTYTYLYIIRPKNKIKIVVDY